MRKGVLPTDLLCVFFSKWEPKTKRRTAEERKLSARHERLRENFESTKLAAFRDLDAKFRRIRESIPKEFAKRQKQLTLEVQVGLDFIEEDAILRSKRQMELFMFL